MGPPFLPRYKNTARSLVWAVSLRKIGSPLLIFIMFPLYTVANVAFEQGGLAEAEQVLINYYKSDVREITHWIKNSSEAFAVRYDLLKNFFEDHFAERYHASTPLGVINRPLAKLS